MEQALDPQRPAGAGEETLAVATAEPNGGQLPSLKQDERPVSPRPRLGDRDWQTICYVVLTLLGSLALLWALWQVLIPIGGILLLFLFSAVLAFVLAPPVNTLAARIGRRVPAILVVYLIAGLVIVGGLVVLARPFAAQATALLNELPRYASELQAHAPEIESTLGGYGLPNTVDQVKTGAVRAIQESGALILTHLVGTAAEAGGLLANALLALVISFYLLVDGPRLRARAHALVPLGQRDAARFVEENVARVLGGYLRGQVVMSASIGLIAGLGCALLGLPYAVVLGVLAGLFELVPMFGPILSAAPAVLLALFLPFPTVLWVLVFFVVLQQFESNVLGPRITGHAVGLHPLGALFALLVGFQLAGILGGLFAVPVAGIVWVFVAAAYRNTLAPPERVS